MRDPTVILEGVDVLPTLLALCAIQSPPHLAGRSFANLLLGRDYSPRQAALTEFTGWKTLRTPNHRYLIQADGQGFLWEIQADNKWLLDGDSPRLADHRHLLLQRLLSKERPLPRTWPY